MPHEQTTPAATPATAPAPVTTPAHQAVAKLNALFVKLFQEKIISGRAYYIGDHPEKPVAFYVADGATQTISTHSWSDGKGIAALFNSIAKTSSRYENYTGGQYFELKSTDNFQTLLATSDEKLKQTLVGILQAKAMPRFGYKPAVKVQAPVSMGVSFVDALSGQRLESSVFIRTASNNFHEWIRDIWLATYQAYRINVGNMTALKFRLNGFDPTDPGVTYTAQTGAIDLSKFTHKTYLTVRVPSPIFNALTAEHAKMMAVNAKANPAATSAVAINTAQSGNTVHVPGGPSVKASQPAAMSNGASVSGVSITVVSPGGSDAKAAVMNNSSGSSSSSSSSSASITVVAPGGPNGKAAPSVAMGKDVSASDLTVALTKFSFHATPAAVSSGDANMTPDSALTAKK